MVHNLDVPDNDFREEEMVVSDNHFDLDAFMASITP
jgi:hypothetical protein